MQVAQGGGQDSRAAVNRQDPESLGVRSAAVPPVQWRRGESTELDRLRVTPWREEAWPTRNDLTVPAVSGTAQGLGHAWGPGARVTPRVPSGW